MDNFKKEIFIEGNRVRLVAFYADCIVCLLLPNLVDKLLFTADKLPPSRYSLYTRRDREADATIAFDIDFTTIKVYSAGKTWVKRMAGRLRAKYTAVNIRLRAGFYMRKVVSLKQLLDFRFIWCTLLILLQISVSHPVHASNPTSPVLASPNDSAIWPVISAENARYLTLKGIYGHGKNRQAIWAGDGHTIIVGGDRGIWIYDVRRRETLPESLDEPDLPVCCMALSHDGRSLAVSAGRDRGGYGSGGSIRVWDIASRTLKISIPTNTIPVSFSPDDRQIIGYGWQHGKFAPGLATTWDIQTGLVLASAESPYLIEDFLWRSPSGSARFGIRFQAVAVIDAHGSMGIWSVVSPDSPNKYVKYQPSENLIKVSPDRFLTSSQNEPIFAINWSKRWLWVFDFKRGLMDVIDVSADRARKSNVSPDGAMQVVIERGAVAIRLIETNNLVTVLPGKEVVDFAFSPDDRNMALLTSEKAIDIVDVQSGKQRFSLIGHQAPILQLAFSSDGKWIATTSADQTVRLWDANVGQQRRIWYPEDKGTALAFSPDSQILAVSGARSTVRLWNVNTGQLRTAVYGVSPTNTGLIFHPNGLLSVYSSDGLVQWDWQQATAHKVSSRKNFSTKLPSGKSTPGRSIRNSDPSQCAR